MFDLKHQRYNVSLIWTFLDMWSCDSVIVCSGVVVLVASDVVWRHSGDSDSVPQSLSPPSASQSDHIWVDDTAHCSLLCAHPTSNIVLRSHLTPHTPHWQSNNNQQITTNIWRNIMFVFWFLFSFKKKRNKKKTVDIVSFIRQSLLRIENVDTTFDIILSQV